MTERSAPRRAPADLGKAVARTALAGMTALTALLAGCGGGEGGAAPGTEPLPLQTLQAETVVLTGTQPATLRRKPEQVLAVTGHDPSGNRIDYAQGVDWQATAGGLVRTPGSRIPDLANHQPVLAADGRFDFSADPRNPPLTVHWQVQVDYQTRRADRLLQPAAGARRDTRVLCLGDSIAAGAHTLANLFQGTDDDSYCGLLRSHLGPGAQVQNPSVPGGTLAAVLSAWPALLAGRPQTVVLAFGMNDHLAGSAGLPAFEASLTATVRQAQAAGARVILVGFMRQNSAWRLEDPAQTEAYNDAIARVAGITGVVFLEVRDLLDRSAPDRNAIAARTGDFMHHPNSYAHRLHFALLLPHFLAAPTAASAVAGYADPDD